MPPVDNDIAVSQVSAQSTQAADAPAASAGNGDITAYNLLLRELELKMLEQHYTDQEGQLTPQITSLQQQINDLQTRIGQIDARLGDIATRRAQIPADMQASMNRAADLQSQIDALQQEDASLAAEEADINSSMNWTWVPIIGQIIFGTNIGRLQDIQDRREQIAQQLSGLSTALQNEQNTQSNLELEEGYLSTEASQLNTERETDVANQSNLQTQLTTLQQQEAAAEKGEQQVQVEQAALKTEEDAYFATTPAEDDAERTQFAQLGQQAKTLELVRDAGTAGLPGLQQRLNDIDTRLAQIPSEMAHFEEMAGSRPPETWAPQLHALQQEQAALTAERAVLAPAVDALGAEQQLTDIASQKADLQAQIDELMKRHAEDSIQPAEFFARMKDLQGRQAALDTQAAQVKQTRLGGQDTAAAFIESQIGALAPQLDPVARQAAEQAVDLRGSGALQEAVDSLQKSVAVWNEQNITETVAAADMLMQSLWPAVQDNLRTALAAGPTGDLTREQQNAMYTQAVDKALKDAGLDITSAEIGDNLLQALASPAFSAMIQQDPSRADVAYNILGFFQPKALAVLGVAQEMGSTDPAGQMQRDATRNLLESMMTTPPASAPPPPTPDDKHKAAGAIAQWTVASLRWAVAGAKKAADGVKGKPTDIPLPTEAQLNQFENLLQGVLERASIAIPSTGAVRVPPTSFTDASGNVIGTTFQQAINWARAQVGLSPNNPVVDNWIQTAGKSVSDFIDGKGVGAVLAFGSMVVRAVRLANPQHLPVDQTTQRQLILSVIGDAGIITEWATAPQRLGHGLNNAIGRIESWLGDPLGMAALGQWDIEMGPVQDALAVPTNLSPQTAVGKFLGKWIPQVGGVSNLIYGGFNIGQGVRQIVNGQPVSGSLTTLTGAIDFFNGFVQLKRAITPTNAGDVWDRMRNFGVAYPVWAEVTTRFVASGAALTSAGLLG